MINQDIGPLCHASSVRKRPSLVVQGLFSHCTLHESVRYGHTVDFADGTSVPN